MKINKLLLLTFMACFVFSCSKDTFEDEKVNESNDRRVAQGQFDESLLGVYKGLFTTNDGLTRGTVVLSISLTSESVGQITLSTGEVIELKSSEIITTVDNPVTDLSFSTVGLTAIPTSLNFSVNKNGSKPSISNVILGKKDSNILIAKELSRAPLNTITGTYMRTSGSGGFPTSGRTWNIMSIGAGDQTYGTQIFYGGNIYNTMPTGTQSNCVDDDTLTTCDIDGSTTILGHDVTWNGTHTYDLFEDNNACSEVSGTWAAPTYGNSAGTFVSDSDCSTVIATNDICEDAISIGLDESLVGFNGFATDADTSVDCTDNLFTPIGVNGVWYSFTSPGDLDVQIDTEGSPLDTQIRLFSGTCGALTCLDNNDDTDTTLQSEIVFSATSGETYYIFVAGYDDDVESFIINVSAGPEPFTNDFCEGATSISCGGSNSINTADATFGDSTEDCADNIFGFPDSAAVWYTYTTPTAQDVTVTTINSDYDTNLKIFSGSCGALTCIANADDIDFPDFPQSEITFSAAAGETYYFQVGGYNDATGNLVIDVSCALGRNSLAVNQGQTKAEYFKNKNLNISRADVKLQLAKLKKAK